MTMEHFPTKLMPVIFTTAKLWTSTTNLANAYLSQGTISADQVNLQQVPWLFLQYPVSPSLQNDFAAETAVSEFAKLLDSERMRSIAIVNAEGIDSFFQEFHEYRNNSKFVVN